jgi:adenosylcobyric acid synthase
MKGTEVVGYEIHMGRTRSNEEASAFQVYETPQGMADYYDGTLNAQGTVFGTYLHGLFHNADFRQALLSHLRLRSGLPEKGTGTPAEKENQYDRLAELVRNSLNIEAIYRMME